MSAESQHLPDNLPDYPLIVYIAGFGRSGSTLLDILLGNHEDIASLGEVASLFKQAGRLRCSCGQDVSACEVWRPISESVRRCASGDWARARQTQAAVEAFPPGLAAPLAGRRSQREAAVAIYRQLMRELFRAIKEVTGRPIAVDSSKTAWRTLYRPLRLATLCGLDVRVIHLIRDGRRVMGSEMRGTDPQIERGAEGRRVLRGYKAVASWAWTNLLTAWVLRELPRGNVMRLRYEDLMQNPAGTLEEIGAFIDVNTAGLQARVAACQPLVVHHLLGGNRLARQQRAVTFGLVGGRQGNGSDQGAQQQQER